METKYLFVLENGYCRKILLITGLLYLNFCLCKNIFWYLIWHQIPVTLPLKLKSKCLRSKHRNLLHHIVIAI